MQWPSHLKLNLFSLPHRIGQMSYPNSIHISFILICILVCFFHRYSDELELDDAVHTAILTLKEGFEGQMTAENIEVGICDETGFRRLNVSTVRDHLANIP